MKLSLKKILKELKPTDNVDVPYQPPHFAHAKTSPSTSQQLKKKPSLKQRVDSGKQEIQQSREGTFYYKGGVLHREDGPAVIPFGAKVQRLEGGTEMAPGGEYYLYGRKYPDFAAWYRVVRQMKGDPEIRKMQQRAARHRGPPTEEL